MTVSTGQVVLGLILLLVVAGPGGAFEIPAGEQEPSAPPTAAEMNDQRDQSQAGEPRVSCSLQEMLADMSPAEKTNAILRLDVPSDVDSRALSLVQRFHDRWDSEDFATAVAIAAELEAVVGEVPIGIACEWRVPVPATDDGRSGPDVRIGSRDSVVSVDLDVDWSTGDLWAVLVVEGDGLASRITWNRSSSNGASWGEYGWFGYSGYTMDVMQAAIAGDTLYSVFKYYDWVRIVKVRVPSGSILTFDGGGYTNIAINVGEPGDVADLAIATNADWSNPSVRVYVTCISTDDELFAAWATGSAETWNMITTGVFDADRGLSCCMNYGYTEYWWFTSYFDNTDNLCIDGYTTGSWNRLRTTTARTSNATLSSIGAYKDTITCAHEYKGLPEPYIRYQVSYNGGDSWLWLWVHDTTVTQFGPALSARRGGGVGISYRLNTGAANGDYVWRDYKDDWTEPKTYSDHNVYWNHQPAMEYLPNGAHGIVYIKGSAPDYRSAWFDRTSCCMSPIRGNADYDAADACNIVDLTFTVAYLFSSGPEPDCEAEMDVTADQVVNIVDLTYLVAYLFSGGSAPEPCP